VVGHHGDVDEEDGANAQGALLHRRVEQVVGIALGAPVEADRLALVVQHLAVKERLAAGQDLGVGVKIHFRRIVRGKQGLDDGAAQVGARVDAGDGLDHDVAAGEVDVGPALVLIRVFDVVKLARKQRSLPLTRSSSSLPLGLGEDEQAERNSRVHSSQKIRPIESSNWAAGRPSLPSLP